MSETEVLKKEDEDDFVVIEETEEEASAAPEPKEEKSPEPEPKAEEPKEEPKKSEEDLSGISDAVKKRIDKLTFKMREAERREQAAIEYATASSQHAYNIKPEIMAKMKKYYTDAQIVEISSVVGLFNFINRFNDSLGVLPDISQKPAPGAGFAS